MFKNTLRVIDKIKSDIQAAYIALEIIINLVIIGLNIYSLYDFIVNENIFGVVVTIALLVSFVLSLIMKPITRKNKSKKAKAIKKELKQYYKFFKKLKKNADKIPQFFIVFVSFTAGISKAMIIPILIMILLPYALKLVIKYVEVQLEALKNAFMEDVSEPFETAGQAIGKAWDSVFKKKEKKPPLTEGNTTLFDESDLIVFDEDYAKDYDEQRDEQLIIL